MEDFHNHKEAFSEWMNSLTADEGKLIKLKKYELQRAFPDVKKSFIDEMAQHKMLEILAQVPMDQWPVAEESLDKGLQQTIEDVVQVNARLEELQDQLDDLIISSQMKYSETQAKLKSLEEKMSEVGKKRALLDEMEAKHATAIRKMEEKNIPTENFLDHLQQQRVTLGKIGPCKAETEAVMASLEAEMDRLKKECTGREKTIVKLKRFVTMKDCEKQEKDKNVTDNNKWISGMLTSIVNLSGMELLHWTDDIVILRMKSVLNPSISAKMTLKFEVGSCSHQRNLSSAEIDLADFDISEVVSRAVAANDPAVLITHVQDVLNNPLTQEVDELRSQYAVDYLHEEGVLRLMMGFKGQIICTLQIEPGYPHAGRVKLTALDGVKKNKSLDEYKPPAGRVKLTDWVEYLQKEIETL